MKRALVAGSRRLCLPKQQMDITVRHCSAAQTSEGDAKQSTSLARQLAAKIRFTGPVSVAEFMRECLVHPTHGYYSKKESFVGASKESSDFVTSPELSAIFGELVAVWIIHQVQQQSLTGAANQIGLVELGPGTGTMMSDMLRTIAKLAKTTPQTKSKWNVHLVEASRRLANVQRTTLTAPELALDFPNIHWHEQIDSAFKALHGSPAVFVAHEFLDALPIHKFKRVSDHDGKTTWREVLLDLDTSSDENRQADPKFRYVLARGPTPTSITFHPVPEDTRKEIEICPQAVRTVDRIARHLAATKQGVALFADYGHVGDGEDTFRAYSKSKQVDPLSTEPGTCDLTADVDFAALAAAVGKIEGVRAIGPVTQREFLVNMGFLQRLEVLLRTCRERGDAEGRKRLLGQAEMLLSDQHMGARFKFMAIVPEGDNAVVPGFSPLW